MAGYRLLVSLEYDITKLGLCPELVEPGAYARRVLAIIDRDKVVLGGGGDGCHAQI